MQAFYAPLDAALAALRAGETQARGLILDFLVADPWCFRSGCMKAKLMHALSNGARLDGEDRRRAQSVVIKRIVSPQPRLHRDARRLAAAVWDDELRAQVRAIIAGADPRAKAEAEHVLQAVEHQNRSEHGSRRDNHG